jgi:hypothetical protein
MSLEMIANEVRGRIADMAGTKEEVREQVMEQLLATYHFTEMKMLPIIAFSPEAGAQFALRVQESLGAVNDVMFREFGLEPVHIKELDLAVVDTLEEVTEMDIDTLFEKLKG